MAPVRRASEKLGRVRQAPLLTAAANASVDIAKAITSMDKPVIRDVSRPGSINAMRAPGARRWFLISPNHPVPSAMVGRPIVVTRAFQQALKARSEERRVGKECRSRGAAT